MASASEPAKAGSLTKIASSAPIDRAFLIASVARSGPIEIKVMLCPLASPASLVGEFASTIRSASSTAYSSKSFKTASTPARSKTPPAIFFSAQESGTCLMQMAIFMLTCYWEV